MLSNWPYATLSVVVASVVLALFGSFDALSWQRVETGQLWRWFSASFVHYSTSHLVGNSLALLVVGTIAEQSTSSRFAFLIYLTAILMPMALLHFTLPNIQQFAGSSCLAYAMTGVLAVCWWPQQRLTAVFLVLAVLIYQLMRLFSAELSEIRPVWQMHGIAMLFGVLLTALINKKLT